jgi:hypothetical protein
MNANDLIIAGHLSKTMWGGQIQPREQDFVVDARGICMSIPASYSRHPFKVLIEERCTKKEVLPLNPMPDGTCRTLKYQYQKNGIANFIREGSFAATGVIEIEYED